MGSMRQSAYQMKFETQVASVAGSLLVEGPVRLHACRAFFFSHTIPGTVLSKGYEARLGEVGLAAS